MQRAMLEQLFLPTMKISQYKKDIIRKQVNKVLSKLSMSLCKPTSIHFSITSKCNLKCKQCDIWRNQQTKEVSTEEIKKAISDLKEWVGPFTLNISGGEPFMRKDIFEIIEYSTKKGVEVSITTNGSLINKNMADRILESGLKNLNVSLDGIKHQTHDYIRNQKGCFEKVMKTISYTNQPDRKLCLVIATIFMGYNLKEIIPLVRWVEEKKLNGIILQPLYNNFGRKYDPYWYKHNEFWPKDINQIQKVIDDLIEMKKQGYKIINPVKQLEFFKQYFEDPNKSTDLECKVGIKNYALNEKGEALFCFWLNPIGDDLKHKPKEIWTSEEAKIRRQQIKNCKKNCKLLNCHFD